MPTRPIDPTAAGRRLRGITRATSAALHSRLLHAVLTVFLVAPLAAPPDAGAQCDVTTGVMCTNGTMCTARVHNTVSLTNVYCIPLDSNNATGCSPISEFSTTTRPPSFFMLQLMATAIGTNPSCSWSCCGIPGLVSMTPADGLPVELMDFSIEADEPAEDEDQEPESHAEAPSD